MPPGGGGGGLPVGDGT